MTKKEEEEERKQQAHSLKQMVSCELLRYLQV